MAALGTFTIDWPATIAAIAAVAAAIVASLSLRHSKASAEAAQKSAVAAERSTELMASQLKMAAEAQQRQIQNEIADGQPLFAWGWISRINEETSFQFTNKGAVVAQPKVTAENILESWIEPKDVIANGQTGELKVKLSKGQQLPQKTKVTIEFTNKRNEHSKINFNLLSDSIGKCFVSPPEPA